MRASRVAPHQLHHRLGGKLRQLAHRCVQQRQQQVLIAVPAGRQVGAGSGRGKQAQQGHFQAAPGQGKGLLQNASRCCCTFDNEQSARPWWWLRCSGHGRSASWSSNAAAAPCAQALAAAAASKAAVLPQAVRRGGHATAHPSLMTAVVTLARQLASNEEGSSAACRPAVEACRRNVCEVNNKLLLGERTVGNPAGMHVRLPAEEQPSFLRRWHRVPWQSAGPPHRGRSSPRGSRHPGCWRWPAGRQAGKQAGRYLRRQARACHSRPHCSEACARPVHRAAQVRVPAGLPGRGGGAECALTYPPSAAASLSSVPAAVSTTLIRSGWQNPQRLKAYTWGGGARAGRRGYIARSIIGSGLFSFYLSK